MRRAVLVVCAVVVLLTAWYAGSRAVGPSAPAPSPGSVRLGPEPGEAVDAYLARLPADLPPPGAPALALVQFAAERPVADAALPGVEPVTAVFRVPIDGVQTALRFEELGTNALATAQQRAAGAAETDAGRLTGRPAAVAAAEARALADPAAPGLVALLGRGDRAALEAVAAAPGVRAVHAAPPDAQPVELALSPLLPAQTETATPVPDDGPVPPPP